MELFHLCRISVLLYEILVISLGSALRLILSVAVAGICVFRSCGLTESSTDVNFFLRSLCKQSVYLTSLDMNALPHSEEELKLFFVDLLQRGIPRGSSLVKNDSFKGKICLFLDSIDRLKGINADHLDWLPKNLAPNIKIIVTVSNQDSELLATMRRKIRDDHIREIPEVEVNDLCVTVMDHVRHRQRKLSPDQLHIVKELISECPSPLFAKFLAHEMLPLRSHSPPIDVNAHPKKIHTFAKFFLQKLEAEVNEGIVAKALALVTLSQFGLSMSELEDMLSLDDQLLNNVFAKTEPKLRRLPSVELVRILDKLRPLLSDIIVDKTRVITWKYDVIRRVARARYVADEETERSLHKLMADFYLGWYASERQKYHNGTPSQR